MPGRKLTPLESRKRLLIAESEVNRALLLRDCNTLANSVHSATQQVKQVGAQITKVGAVVSSAAAVMAVFKAFRPSKTAAVASHAPTSWWSAGMKLARWGLPIWMGFRQRRAAAAAKANGHHR